MYYKNEYINNMAQAERERELKRDVVVDREMGDTEDNRQIMALMDNIERIRKERQNVSNEYTQKKLAEKAGIGLSTYRDYLSGLSDNIKLKTVINITHVLQCRLSDLMDERY